jgi:phage anti-repressor protein
MDIKTYYSERLLKDVISTIELHQVLNLNTVNYDKNIKNWKTELYGFRDDIREPKIGIDYSVSNDSTYNMEVLDLTIEFAKLITLNSKSILKRKYAQCLLELERKKNNLELLTMEQVIFINKLIQFFSFITNQQDVLGNHSKKYVKNRLEKGRRVDELYSFFHGWRNSKLDISQDEIEDNLKEFCIKNQKSISIMKRTKFEKIFVMDNYETLRHAVWDFMHLNNKQEMAHKVAEITYKIASETQVPIFRRNENNLFQQKIDTVLKLS